MERALVSNYGDWFMDLLDEEGRAAGPTKTVHAVERFSDDQLLLRVWVNGWDYTDGTVLSGVIAWSYSFGEVRRYTSKLRKPIAVSRSSSVSVTLTVPLDP